MIMIIDSAGPGRKPPAAPASPGPSDPGGAAPRDHGSYIRLR